MSNITYICPHCKDRKGHKDPRQVRICEIQANDSPSKDEILEYVTLKDDLEIEAYNNNAA
jgi:hypothetical protein